MTTTFKVGDKVEHRTWGPGEIAFGPFLRDGATDNYLMAEPDGEHRLVDAEAMTPAGTFKVGDKVTEYGLAYTIHAGPFFGDTEWYAVEDARGRVMYASPGDTAIVEPANTHTYKGVTYDLSAKYEDRTGDVWEFTGKRRSGVPTVTMSGYVDNTDTIDEIADNWGPLTRVND